MVQSNAQCSLFLCPVQQDFSIEDIAGFISVLQAIGFVAEKINPSEPDDRYFSGDDFLKYISYMGCAPAIQFEASDSGGDFCYVHLHQYESAKLIHSKIQTRPPHCPDCHKPVKNWQQNLMTDMIVCQHCNTGSRIEAYDWRKMAGYARLFIEITDVFPKEALPQPALLEKLTTTANTEWQYFYACR